MKEIKVRLTEKQYEKLRHIAEKEMRSINQQSAFYILRGMGSEEIIKELARP